MEITEVRIKLMDEPGERLKAFCSITFDNCFVVRDLKIIEGSAGPFVAMPSRKLTAHCRDCGTKNHLRAVFCNQCGARLESGQEVVDEDGRAKLYADIAHPINSNCRELIQGRVIEEYELEMDRAKQPGYVSRYDDFDAECPSKDGASRDTRSGSREAAGPREGRQDRYDASHATPPSPQPPRGPSPHETPEHIPSPTPSKRQRPKSSNDNFGAGIF